MTSPRPTSHSLFVFSTLGAGLLLSHCGGTKEPETPVVVAPPRPPPTSHGPKMQVQGELGSIDEKATNQTFEHIMPQLNACYTQGRKRIDFLAGDVKLFVRIAQEGRARFVVLEDSTLGDWDTENCMLGILRDAVWPKPEGGEAEVRKGFGFDAPGNVRAPNAWPIDKMTTPIAKAENEIKKCKKGESGLFRVTAYVHPEGKKGKVEAAGFVPPTTFTPLNTKDLSPMGSCLVDLLKGLKDIPTPGSYPAKVTFSL